MVCNNKNQSGFALLMTLVVVSVVISVALTLIDLTIKQLRLATSSKDSESAFHAANAGVECIRYWRVVQGGAFELGTGPVPTINCFGVNATPNRTDLGSGIFMYDDIKFVWGNRCSEATFITMSTEPTSGGVTLNNVKNHIPSYPEDNKSCDPGGRCTIIAVQGYNHACSANYPLGTVQREVLLEL